ncbi:MAG TPA: DUF1295 domain-containing protein [Bacilli bacterium]|nr:DUF1295 domain-containing protein [Bacilli bacterium]HPS18629.1 DUF1295 domain-containing protein [Bacilli bacterium]
MIKKSKALSLLLVLSIYIAAFIGGYFSSLWIENNICVQFFFADVAATLIVWISSLILKNTSVYDPYWSIAPWMIATAILIQRGGANVYAWIIYAVFSLWSWRLTINWLITFDNLLWEDWRYRHYREKSSKLVFHIVNFAGLQMIPTVLVYGGTLPLLYIIINGASPLALIGAGITLLGVILESLADHQMHSFLKTTKEKKVCQVGLWKLSRHPNYLGENLIWIGLCASLLLSHIQVWYLGYGFVLILLLFEFISIPLMEKRQMERRSDYALYRRTTSRMLILPKFHRKHS